MKFTCPTCSQSLECEDNMAGMSIQCPQCSNSLTIPAHLTPAKKPVSASHLKRQLTMFWSALTVCIVFGVFQPIAAEHYEWAPDDLLLFRKCEWRMSSVFADGLADSTIPFILRVAAVTILLILSYAPTVTRLLTDAQSTVLRSGVSIAFVLSLFEFKKDYGYELVPIFSREYDVSDGMVFSIVATLVLTVAVAASMHFTKQLSEHKQ